MKLVLLVLAVSLCVSSVSAATTMRLHIKTTSLHIRPEPNTSLEPVGELKAGATFEVDCQVSGETISGPSGTISTWYHIPNKGYVSGAWVYGSVVQTCGVARVVIYSTNLNVRSQPNTHSSVINSLSHGSEVSIGCQTTGDMINGDFTKTNIWYYLPSKLGYVSGAYVNPAGKTYPSCSSASPSCSSTDCSACIKNPKTCAEAVSWAEALLDDSSNPEYRGFLDNFAGMAYGRSTIAFTTPMNQWQNTLDKYKHTDRNPPAGALVFFRTSAAGHVTISLGSGNLISTDIDGNGTLGKTTIASLEARRGAPYVGWTNPYFVSE